jgi:hypothetical protein
VKTSKFLLICSVVFTAIGTPFLVGWVAGAYDIFWTVPGAVLVQMYGCAAICAHGAYLWQGIGD